MPDNTLIRIKKYIDAKGISMRAFEISVGFSNGAFSNQLKNNKTIGVDRIEHILNTYPDLNPMWLLTGEGEMTLNIVQEPKVEYRKKEKEYHTIPLLPTEAVAGLGSGNWSVAENDILDEYVIPDFKGADFLIPVKGDSMYPRYSSGDIAACKKIKDGFIQWNKPHVIATSDQGIMVKRIRKSDKDDHLLMVSENKEYAPFDVPRSEITGIAIVIGVIHFE